MAASTGSFPPAAKRLIDSREPFQEALLNWFRTCARPLPWRRTKNPYNIWLSEVILQQTRVEQAIPYYLRFLESFPSISHLAATPLDEVLRQWEGLGYYTRARNLHRAAVEIVERHGGVLPETYDQLLALPGIGPYTAAAVSSIAFGNAHAVVDGNVVRVLSRLVTLAADVTTSAGKNLLQKLADELLCASDPGGFNEAVMELGATVCTPAQPSCQDCPVRAFCLAADGSPESFPRKPAKKKTPHFDIAVAVLNNERGEFYIQRRPENGLLGGLWEFPGGKREPDEPLEETCRREVREELGIDIAVGEHIATIRHAYSHFRITLHAFWCTTSDQVDAASRVEPYRWIAAEDLQEYAFPRANRKLIEILTAPEAPVSESVNH